MMMHTTLAQLRTLKLDGLATGLEEQLTQPGMAAMSFEERVALLVDREVHCRSDRKLLRLLKNAHLKYAQAAIDDIDARSGRGIDRREVMSLALGDWVSAGHSVLITGPTGGPYTLTLTADQDATVDLSIALPQIREEINRQVPETVWR